MVLLTPSVSAVPHLFFRNQWVVKAASRFPLHYLHLESGLHYEEDLHADVNVRGKVEGEEEE